MKRVIKNFFLAVATFISMIATAEAQNSFAYQAVIRTAKGELVSNQKVGMRFSLIHDGKVVYSETHSPETNQYGNVQVEVGKGQNATGDFAAVPWSTMQVMMKIEADPNGGTDYIDLGTIQLQPAPYAMYATAAGMVNTIEAGEPKSDSNALFEVKDKDGRVVFAVYPDGVRVFVNDSASAKAMQTGFAVSGRRAAKEGGDANIFSVNTEGTQVFVGEEDTTGGKPVSTGFAVSGRRAAKDGSADLFTVSSTGTQIYIGEQDGKPISTGFAVSGRRAAKGEEKYLEINADGTRVYIDDVDNAGGKPVSTGFAVSGRRAAKGDADSKYFEINANGTQVFVDDSGDKPISTGFAVSGRRAAKGNEPKLFEVNSYGTQIYIDTKKGKPISTGFAVSGRRAAKDGNTPKYMVIDADGTRIYVDYEEAKAMQTGFAVSGRRAAKDGTPNTILKVDNVEGTRAYIDDIDGKAMQTGFAVSGRRAAKEGAPDLLRITGGNTTLTAASLSLHDKDTDIDMMSITSESTNIHTDELQLLNHNDSEALTTGSGGVEVKNDLVVAGEVAQTVDVKSVDIQPIYMSATNCIDTIVCADTASALEAPNGYVLLKIYGNGLFAQSQNVDVEGNRVMLFDAQCNPTTLHELAVAAVIMTDASTSGAKLIVWPLKQTNNLKINFGLMAAGDTSNRYVPVTALINAGGPVECKVAVKSADENLGTVAVVGPKVYGEKVDIVPQPVEGYHFAGWSDGRVSNPRTVLILHDTAFASAKFEINTYNIKTTAENGTIEIEGKQNADTTYNHGTEIKLTAIPDEHYHFMGWTDGEAAAKREFKIKSDTAFEATFAIDSFKIATLAENGEVTGAGIYAYGTEIELVATTDTLNGFHFVNWSDGNTDNPRKLTVTQDSTFTANFTKNTYALTYIVDGKIDGEIKMVEYEAELTLRKDSVRQGYTFSGWTYNGKNEKPKTMPKGNLTVEGSFTINNHTITYKVDDEVYQTFEKVDYDSVITIIDNPKDKTGYTFSGWSYNGSTVLLEKMPDEDVEIVGTFIINTFVVTATSTEGGSVTISPDANAAEGKYKYGTQVSLNASANENSGYEFKQWTVVDESTTLDKDQVASEYIQFTVNSNVSLKAEFTKKKYHVTASAENGSIAITPQLDEDGYVEHGTVLKIVASATDDTYEFIGWQCSNIELIANQQTSQIIEVGVNNHFDIKAVFAKITHEVSVTSDEHGKVNVFVTEGNMPAEGSKVYEQGTVITITAEPTDGRYEFDKWENISGINVTDVTNSQIQAVTVTESIAATAKFRLKPTITYHPQGGTWAGNSTADKVVPYATGSIVELLSDISREGCTFGGWYSSDKCEGNALTEINGITENVELYAKWKCDFDAVLAQIQALEESATIEVNGFIPEGRNITEIRDALTELYDQNEDVFVNLNLSGVKGLTKLPDEAFANCYNLVGFSLPEGLIEIGDKAFYSCYNITELTFPSTLKKIGDEFFHCEVHLVYYDYENDVYYNNGFTIPASVDSIGTYFGSRQDMSYLGRVIFENPYYWFYKYDGENTESMKDVSNPDANAQTLQGRNYRLNRKNVDTLYAVVNSYSSSSYYPLYNDSESTLRAIDDASGIVDVILFGKVTPAEITHTSGIIAHLKQNSNITGVNLVFAEGANIYMNESCKSMFSGFSKLLTADLRGLNTSGVRDMSKMFYHCDNLQAVNFGNICTDYVTDMSEMFYGCKNLDSINLSNFNTANVTKMNGMFSVCESLKSLDLSSFNTHKVTDMRDMFNQCYNLTDIYFGDNFNTGNVTDMRSMFRWCKNLTSLDLSGFNTENVLRMGGINCGMFDGCSSLTTLDLSGFNTGKVAVMGEMFQDCSELVALDLRGFNTASVTDMDNMFSGCSALSSLDLKSFNTSLVAGMNSMFKGCSSLTELDLSSFQVGETDVTYMFSGCSNLARIYVASDADWSNVDGNLSGGLEASDIFSGCTMLTGGAGTEYSGTRIGKAYTKIDGGSDENPGYFTAANFIYVNPQADDGGDGTIDAPFNSLSAALATGNFTNPDAKYTICIDGVLNECATVSDELNGKVKAIELRGKTGNNYDKLDGSSGGGTVLTISTTVPVTINRLQITGGNAENGGGISMGSGSHVTLGCGALVGEVATTVATSSSYANKATVCGGGIFNNGGVLILENGSVVSHNYGNVGYSGSADRGGAGIYSRGGNVTIQSGAKVMYNYCESRGGGVGLENGAVLTMIGGSIDNNTAKGFGGGVFFSNAGNNAISTKMIMTGGSVSGNSVIGKVSGWGEAGGGLYIDKGTVTVSGTAQINNNSSSVYGGGVAINSGTFDLHGGILYGNTAESNGGAVRFLRTGATFQIGDSAYIPCDGVLQNDVSMSPEFKITLTSELVRPAPVASITPEEFSEGLSVVDVSQPELINESIKFALTDNPDYGVANGTIVRVLGLWNNGRVYFNTFKNAVENADDGAVIYLAQRVYVSKGYNAPNLKLDVPSGKTVTVKRFPGFKGLLIETDSWPYGGLEVNNINGEASGRLVLDGGSEDGLEADDALFYDHTGIVLHNITFQNNNNTSGNGGGFRSWRDVSTTFTNCVIQNCQAKKGGGMYVSSATTLINTVIKNCSASEADGGGGIFAGDDLDANRGIWLMNGSFVTNCKANDVRNNYQFVKHSSWTFALYLTNENNATPVIGDLTGKSDDDIFKAMGLADLGLSSGTLWATKNVGATNPQEYGDYFAWGETETKNDYSERQYSYNANPTTLPSDNDAAFVKCGNGWAMPTAADFEELINGCHWEWSDGYNGSVNKGYIFYRKKGEGESYSLTDTHIFLPAAGIRNGTDSPAGQNVYCYYWSNSLDTEQTYQAKILVMPGTEDKVTSAPRYCGASVRPVRRP